jgi:staphylococcal nuclease domain-containing protein 1
MRIVAQVTIPSSNSNKRTSPQPRFPHLTFLDLLLTWSCSAVTEAVGIHSGKESKLSGLRIVDASENLTRAKQFLSTFQRQKRLPGIIEHVSSGSRFRVFIPRESCRVTFVLGGLRAPRPGRANEKGEEGGEEALEWTSRRAYQRDVEIDVETTDRAGGFIGTLYVGGNNLGKGLLEEGLAWVQGGSGGQEFDEAEARAKKARKGVCTFFRGLIDVDLERLG